MRVIDCKQVHTHSSRSCSPGLYDSSVSTRTLGLVRLQWPGEKSVAAVVVVVLTLAVCVVDRIRGVGSGSGGEGVGGSR